MWRSSSANTRRRAPACWADISASHAGGINAGVTDALQTFPGDALARAHHALFLALNPDPGAGGAASALVPLARFASTVLPELLLAGVLVAAILGPRTLRQRLRIVLAAMALAWLAARSVQALWPQPRPFVLGLGVPWLQHPPTASFPSMHGTVATAFAAALMLWRRDAPAWLACVAAALIGWSRVCLGLHFPLDVLAGAMLGTVAAVFTHTCLSPDRGRWLRGMAWPQRAA